MLSADSPLRRLPSSLNRKQFSFLVGIRYCIESVDLAYRYLQLALTEISERAGTEPEAPHGAYASAVMHSWSIVDSVNRLRVLLDNMPGVKKSEPAMQLLLRRLRQFESLRNPIQHLDSELHKRAQTEQATAVWGTVRWFLLHDGATGGSSYVLYPGSIQPLSEIPVVNPLGQDVYDRLDLVTLDAFDSSVDLSGVHAAVAKFSKELESGLAEQFHGHGHTGADLVIQVEMAFSVSESEHPAASEQPNG